LICAAAYAAPKPLSIFTTVTAAAATVEHAEQCGEAAEARAVADAGRHGDDRRLTSPATALGSAPSMRRRRRDMAGLHARALGEQPVNAGHPDIVDALDAIAEDLERERGFLGDRRSEVPAQSTPTAPSYFGSAIRSAVMQRRAGGTSPPARLRAPRRIGPRSRG